MLGATWSPALAAVEDSDSLVDIIEVPGWGLDAALAARPAPLLLHNLDMDVSLADTSYVDGEWAARANAMIRRAQSPWFSLHLGFSCEVVRFEEHMLPVSDVLPRDELLDRIVATARAARELLDVPLLLENLDYCPEGAYEYVCEPDFIRQVLDATGCGMLLDIGHMRVTASWLGVEPEELLAALPLERVGEVHVSSPRLLESGEHAGLLDDVHAELTDLDMRLLAQALEAARPGALVLEYRGEPEALRRQLVQLRRALDVANSAGRL